MSSADDLLRELATIYHAADELYADHSCPASTECCRFGITGREPYVTSIETAAVVLAVRRNGGLPSKRKRALPLTKEAEREAICPLLKADGRCAVYAARPLGCRTFWCERTERSQRIPHRQMQDLVHQVRDLALRHESEGDRGRPLRRALTLVKP